MRGVASGPSLATPGLSEETVGRVHDHSRQGEEVVDSSDSPSVKREGHIESVQHSRTSTAPHLSDIRSREHSSEQAQCRTAERSARRGCSHKSTCLHCSHVGFLSLAKTSNHPDDHPGVCRAHDWEVVDSSVMMHSAFSVRKKGGAHRERTALTHEYCSTPLGHEVT